MSLLGGGEQGRRPASRQFQGAPAGASQVRKKEQVGSGLVNLNKLRNIQSRKKSIMESYRLNANGLSRFRLVMPIAPDDVPMVSADQHWLPWVNDEGKIVRRPVYCYKQFGFDDCPICALRELLMDAHDPAVSSEAEKLKPANRWAAWVVNRDYMAGAEDPNEVYDPRQDKIQLFDGIQAKIGDDIIKHLTMRAWGDASDPENGYDFECEGTPSGKVFNNFKVSDYALSPMPREFSPAYSRALLKGIKPLSAVVKYMQRQDFQKIFDPILLSLQQETEEGSALVEGFADYYNQLLAAIEAGPAEDDEYDTAPQQEQEPEREVIEVQEPAGGDVDAKGEDSALEGSSEDSGDEPDDAQGFEGNAEGESPAEDAEPGEEDGPVAEDEPAPSQAPVAQTPKRAPSPIKPRPGGIKPAPSPVKPSPAKASESDGGSLMSKLRSVGK